MSKTDGRTPDERETARWIETWPSDHGAPGYACARLLTRWESDANGVYRERHRIERGEARYVWAEDADVLALWQVYVVAEAALRAHDLLRARGGKGTARRKARRRP